MSLRRLIALVPFALCAAESASPAGGIQVPPGFEITRVAAAPLVNFPMMGGFDDRGRLFVAENAGVNLDEKELAAHPPSRVIVLEDTDGDGTFDRSAVFADKLTFPQGVLWLDGALYVASPPSIWKLEDTDGDGRADQRTEIATGFKFTGNAADVHGPFLHPNGRLYWCHGRKGHEVHQRDGTLVSKALGARVWSCRPDGSDIQVHAGGGMDNPVELAFSQEGEIFGDANIFQGSPRVDAIIHWIYGGVYPRNDIENVLAEFKRTGDLLGPAAPLGHVAPSGLTLLRTDALGAGFAGSLMLAEFNTHRLMRIPLERDGATFRGRPEIFAITADTGVHFTGVIEDADGSLLAIDTGAWFRRGCPTSGVARTDIQGAIYRIRRANAPRIADPRGLAIGWAKAAPGELAALLGDTRPFVRDRAIRELARRGDAAVPALRAALPGASALARSNAVWALTRIGSAAAQAAARVALSDSEANVRQVACQSAFVTADQSAHAALVRLLEDPAAPVRRESARALGRLRQPNAVAPLANAAAVAADPALTHALIFALIEIGAPEETRRQLSHAAPRARRAALIALDQIAGANLEAASVFSALRSTEAGLRSAALAIAVKHPEWSREAAEFLSFALADARDSARSESGRSILVAFIRAAGVRDWLRAQFGGGKIDPRVALDAIGTTAEAWDDAWRGFLVTHLRSPDAATAQAALRAIGVHRARDFSAALREVAHDSGRPAAFRVAALQVAAGAGKVLDADSLQLLTAPFATGGTPEARAQAATVLGAATLDRSQLLKVIALLPQAGPLELTQLLGVFQRGPTDLDLAASLLARLRETPSRFGVTGGAVQAAFRRFPEPGPANAAPLVSEIMNAAVAKDSRVLELEKLTAGGDAARGRAAFLAGAGACQGCHRIGEAGGRVGPDLSHIGAIRTARDLVESIAFPDASIARGFEGFRLERRGGEPLLGMIPRETADAIVVATPDGQEHVVPRAAIVKLEPAANSLMPPGLDRVLEPKVFADLIAFLKSLQ
ncbi:MAG: HEAT repeat domain-containing protein [Verrucomicrobia bacterium]|nr:HEAT repeat domain-containing protein [Verrucomicrobiota bacterium]